VAQVRPWVRYWARMFDIYLFGIVVAIVIVIANPHAFDDKDSEQMFGLCLIFGWVFVESLFISTIGNTPGKWLLKTQLVPPAGVTPSYSIALSRSLKVWWRGLGIGFPIASLITLIVAHRNMHKNSVTSWDQEDGFTVVHHRIGPLRVVVAVVFFLSFLLLVVVGNAADANN